VPAFLVAEAEADADEEADVDGEVAETGAALVGEETSVPVDEPAEELKVPTGEVAEVAEAAVLLEAQTTASGTVTPAEVQICLAYATASA
jgi:hypothetical protein